jgi:hypothetical protein
MAVTTKVIAAIASQIIINLPLIHRAQRAVTGVKTSMNLSWPRLKAAENSFCI